jgi:hypothetical protein
MFFVKVSIRKAVCMRFNIIFNILAYKKAGHILKDIPAFAYYLIFLEHVAYRKLEYIVFHVKISFAIINIG